MEAATWLAIIIGCGLVFAEPPLWLLGINGNIVAYYLAFILVLIAFHMRSRLKDEQRN